MAAIADEGRGRSVARPRWRLAPAALVPIAALALVAALLVFGVSETQAPGGAEAATVLTILAGDVEVETDDGIQVGRDGMRLSVGDRIVTGAGARAVLTFFDGSTVTLNSDTVVVIRSLVDDNGQLHALLDQSRGSTWTHIPQELGPAQVEIDTPNARVEASEASFATTVEDGGPTHVGAQSGALAVTSGDQRVEVTEGHEASVDAAGVVGPASVTDRPRREVLVRVRGPVFAFLTNPDGATVGRLPPGVPVNQVHGATLSREGDQLLLRLRAPANGQYILGLRAAAAGGVDLTAEVRNGTSNVRSRIFRVAAGDNWIISLRLRGDALTITGVERVQQDVTPPHVTVPERAVEKAKATPVPTSTATPTSTPRSRPAATPTTTATSEPTATPTSTAKPQLLPTATPTPPADSLSPATQ